MVTTRPTPDPVDAALVPSANPDGELATHNRLDPYWDGLWAPGSHIAWTTGPLARQNRRDGRGTVNRKLLLDKDEALEVLTSNRGRTERHLLWGILDSWRTVSSEQAAAFAGTRLLQNQLYSQVAASFALDLIDVGTYTTRFRRAPETHGYALYRPSSTDVFDRAVKDTLTWPEWVSVTGGYPWSGAGQHDRHNVLAAELGLRAAEYLPVGAVLGEKFSSVDLLCGSGLGKSVSRPDNRRADGTIVRADGLRIAYELTANASPFFRNKVRRWAKLLSAHPLETSGLVIVFVTAPHVGGGKGKRHDPRNDTYRAIADVLREFPGTGPDSPAARLGVAHWDQWFPARHQLSESFFTVTADFPVGSGTGPERWAPRDLFGDYAFSPWHSFDPTALIDNTPLLAASPHWLRKGDHTHLIGSPMDRAGEPVPVPRKPGEQIDRPLGAGVGRAGDTKLPRRLRIEW